MSVIEYSQDLDEIEFRFQDEEEPMDYTTELTHSLDVSPSTTIHISYNKENRWKCISKRILEKLSWLNIFHATFVFVILFIELLFHVV